MNIKEYFVSIFKGFYSLIKGMEVTGKELVTPKVTEQYPENRAELHIPERFRATLGSSSSMTRTATTSASPAAAVSAIAPTRPSVLPNAWSTCPTARRK